LKIHPLAAIFAVLVGAEIGGIVGICLAVSMMASHYGLNIQGCAARCVHAMVSLVQSQNRKS